MGVLRAELKGIELVLETTEQLFSPEGIDRGTLAMLSTVEFKAEDKVLDLGCGYGVVGILAARLIAPERVTMVDVNPEAVAYAERNAITNGVPGVKVTVSDGLEGVAEEDFTLILSNPPYHEDFSVPKAFIESGFQKLALGGKMVMVVKRLAWYQNKLAAIFGGAKVEEIDGYYILTAEKRSAIPAKKENASVAKVSRKHQKRAEEAARWKKRTRR